ncbi:MAG: aminoacyl-tRNA hydrolase [Bdellovibrionales bacterium RIFOXYD12_FULL_39_22]|nr:MAG: aminoacyl-tRNA hydrolase [Bdellovibrionales bacterium RIFOXYB1_FULL_39_21]OFZ45167.1 MAG: aminoacyl-tRNA hydrolase [Bdellovibrionales bacterium RIFOXYC12_FULL_39_17]OFZ45641.1 MAG: aminoacyl-tRNA hydrolase [Bdellovibrionales bacterium RIFOXYC1_FULL_39_130]OFZ74694.1 MAG: aminoacyl-tRNA hydrolase [Bdellovibrionales bacterium RIFOXYC2_FULL_39_8]OFZ77503.1 MAG: aminoacyl-tRNA hydrolase [Bdellovibrionales bacterium RIFOXYD1_FULL_39_84]OFZ91632.1 MAG: aminoacyl-tRNA hydrolase [Bdellovibrion
MGRLVVGLGNPGAEYDETRHNIGWAVLDSLSFADKLNWRDKFKGLYAEYAMGDEKIYFLKPMTYMNLSGQSVLALSSFFKVAVADILVVHDEVDLPFGTIALKRGGGLAGHNGLKSIAQLLGSQDFLRLRMGVGRPIYGSMSGWVLSKFTKEEEVVLSAMLEGTAKAINIFLEKGFDHAASAYSKKNFVITPEK